MNNKVPYSNKNLKKKKIKNVTIEYLNIYQAIWYLTSGKRQSVPSAVFPLTPIGINLFQAGNGFLDTYSIAFSTNKGRRFLASAP